VGKAISTQHRICYFQVW